MRPLRVVLLVALFPLSTFAADRYWTATRSAPRVAPLRLLQDSDESRRHAVRAFESVDAFAADLNTDEVASLKRSPDVRYVSPLVPRYASGDDSRPRLSANGSPYLSSQTVPYGVTMIHANDLWRFTRGGGGAVNIAIMDTGIDVRHPDLAPNFAGGYNTFSPSDQPIDDNGHGTHVAGTIAAIDNNFGVVGVAPQARIWSVKVLDHLGLGTDENIVGGIDWVIAKKHEIGGDWIMSLSLGAQQDSVVEAQAFKRVIAEGIIVVAASGNRGFPDVEFPAGYPDVIAVGAVDSTATLASFSDRGPHLSVVAPGVSVLSTARVGSIASAGLTLNGGKSIAAAALGGSSRGEVVGSYIACGLGKPDDFPVSVRGKIALIKRGDITFNEKVRNAEVAGAAGVVIYNKDESDFKAWTLLRPDCDTIEGCDDSTHSWPVVLGISNADGVRLAGDAAQTLDMGSWFDDYTIMNGTSMATPHVSGAVALVWSLAPNASADHVRNVLLSTATDLGAPGFDTDYGFGLVNALSAARRLAPQVFRPDASPRVPAPEHPDHP